MSGAQNSPRSQSKIKVILEKLYKLGKSPNIPSVLLDLPICVPLCVQLVIPFISTVTPKQSMKIVPRVHSFLS